MLTVFGFSANRCLCDPFNFKLGFSITYKTSVKKLACVAVAEKGMGGGGYRNSC